AGHNYRPFRMAGAASAANWVGLPGGSHHDSGVRVQPAQPGTLRPVKAAAAEPLYGLVHLNKNNESCPVATNDGVALLLVNRPGPLCRFFAALGWFTPAVPARFSRAEQHQTALRGRAPFPIREGDGHRRRWRLRNLSVPTSRQFNTASSTPKG